MRNLLLCLLLLLAPVLADSALSKLAFQLELDCSSSAGALGPARVEMPNGATREITVPGLGQAQVFVNITTHRMGIAYLTYQVRSAQPVEMLTSNQQVVMMGQAPAEFRFRLPGQEVCLRTRALRIAAPEGCPHLDDSAPMPTVPGLMPGSDAGCPQVQLPPGMDSAAPPGFVLPGSSRL